MTDNMRRAYEVAIVQVLRQYGTAVEAFGRASAGSTAERAKTRRLAECVARDTLGALLGREPKAVELEQIPPSHVQRVTSVSTERSVSPVANSSRKKPRRA